jgi:hypothetical protein
VTVTNVIERVGGLFPNIAYRWMKLVLLVSLIILIVLFFFPLINRKRERGRR